MNTHMNVWKCCRTHMDKPNVTLLNITAVEGYRHVSYCISACVLQFHWLRIFHATNNSNNLLCRLTIDTGRKSNLTDMRFQSKAQQQPATELGTCSRRSSWLPRENSCGWSRNLKLELAVDYGRGWIPGYRRRRFSPSVLT